MTSSKAQGPRMAAAQPRNSKRKIPAERLASLPSIHPLLLRGFRVYTRRYIRKHFHAVRMAKTGRPPSPPPSTPLLIIMNHPSWWDPLLGLFLAERYFKEHSIYAPIESTQLEKYGILKRLGFYGVDKQSSAGARHFVKVSTRILSQPRNIIWMTPQGRFVDARNTDYMLERGAALLLRRLPRLQVLPVAVEYAFWNDRLPEVLVRFGKPRNRESLTCPSNALNEINESLANELKRLQIALAEDSVSRDPARFDTCQIGTAGVGGVYDWQRRLRAWWNGRQFTPEHGGTNA